MRKRRKDPADIISNAIVIIILAVLFFVGGGSARVLIADFIHPIRYTHTLRNIPDDGTIEVHVVNVGQADAILVRTANGNVLIDAGTNESEPQLKAHLDACRISGLTAFICTHPHGDHIGGADMIVRDYNIDTLIMPKTDETFELEMLNRAIDDRGVKVHYATLGDVYEFGDVKMTVLSPISPSDNFNDTSLVIKLTFGDTAFLFTGDSEAKSENHMLEAYTSGELDCDFLKVAHHGANTSSSKEFLETVSPKIAAISCGLDNEHGHPRGEVLHRLELAGCDTVLRTDRMGTVIVRSDGEDIELVITEYRQE